MQVRKVICSAGCIALLTVSLCSCQSNSNESSSVAKQAPENDQSQQIKMKPGTYEGTAKGMNAPIKVQVKVSENKIEDVQIIEHHETKGISDPAVEKLPKAIVDVQGLGIDTVSGATFSSVGILNATDEALKQSGVDLRSLKKIKGEIEHDVLPEERDYDVLILGSGGSGLTAALSAVEQGAKVLVIEKMAATGGNTALSGGAIAAPDNWVQEKEGIKDSVEDFYNDVRKGGDFENNESLVRKLAENALPAVEWLKKDANVEFEDYMNFFGGHSVKRSLMPKDHTGTEITRKLAQTLKDKNVTILHETKAEKLLVDKNGRVTGVECDYIGKEKVTFNARKGVVISTGGFGANVEMRKKSNPEFDEKYMSTDSVGSTGDGIVMAEDVNANLVDMDFIQTYPTCDPETGRISYLANMRLQGRAILVNTKGQRFVEELERRDVISKAILAQEGSYAYLFWDEKGLKDTEMDKKYPYEFKNVLDRGILIKGDTIEELAKKAGVDAGELQTTINRFNSFVDKGKDEDFNLRGKLTKFESVGPYYLLKCTPSVHHTMGGLQIDTDAHVLDKNGDIIKGLYAAGEVTGDIHGTNRLGSVAITDLIVFGKTAGANAAQAK